MKPLDARAITVTIRRQIDAAYAFAARPENFPMWAAGLSSSLHMVEDRWQADTPEGTATVRFSPQNAFGILDHWVSLPGKPEIYIPLRLVANGEATEAIFLLFRQPGMTDETFEADAAMVVKDLHTLKALLEDGK